MRKYWMQTHVWDVWSTYTYSCTKTMLILPRYPRCRSGYWWLRTWVIRLVTIRFAGFQRFQERDEEIGVCSRIVAKFPNEESAFAAMVMKRCRLWRTRWRNDTSIAGRWRCWARPGELAVFTFCFRTGNFQTPTEHALQYYNVRHAQRLLYHYEHDVSPKVRE